ncbi:PREDICTED: uncharacterized protein LOC104788349 [Camelina sativa]|uniref:Uncharacterized protein LOC104788349 n=1 Tax=Camelina sativa TaxID=90675 RepID=A0ABM0Z9N1_CAMSA|nr:PREDICTED: uncharacterized protein LOC104788349 [Camelina sativa]
MEDEKTEIRVMVLCFLFCLIFIGIIGRASYVCNCVHTDHDVPDITVPLMNIAVLNSTKTRFSAKWNLSIRVPNTLPGPFICLQGDFQASLLYKNITIATSPAKSYNNLQPYWAQLLKVSGVVSEEDTNGAIAKNIMGDIKETNEVWFGSRLFFPDCREMTTGMMSYTCDEAKFHIDSNSQITATAFGNPICHYDYDH